MKRKYFVISDVHGYYDIMIKALEDAGFDETNDSHMIISCGDAIDRGKQSVQVVKFLTDMYFKGKCIMIKGNHEYEFDKIIHMNAYPGKNHYTNRTIHSVCQFAAAKWNCKFVSIGKAKRDWAVVARHADNYIWQDYWNNCVNYFQTKNFIFVHGFVPTDNWYRFNGLDTYGWYEASWQGAFFMWKRGDWRCEFPNKKLVVGHIASFYWNHLTDVKNDNGAWWNKTKMENWNFNIYEDEHIVAIDTCTTISRKVNVYVVEDEEME